MIPSEERICLDTEMASKHFDLRRD